MRILVFHHVDLSAVPEGPDLCNEAAGQRAAGGGGLLDGHRHMEAGVGTRRAGQNQIKSQSGPGCAMCTRMKIDAHSPSIVVNDQCSGHGWMRENLLDEQL